MDHWKLQSGMVCNALKAKDILNSTTKKDWENPELEHCWKNYFAKCNTNTWTFRILQSESFIFQETLQEKWWFYCLKKTSSDVFHVPMPVPQSNNGGRMGSSSPYIAVPWYLSIFRHTSFAPYNIFCQLSKHLQDIEAFSKN